MILRIALFISLLTIFYFYCQNDSQSVLPGSEGGFLPEAPLQNSPAYQYDLMPGNTSSGDSSINYVTVSQSLISEDQLIPALVAKN